MIFGLDGAELCPPISIVLLQCRSPSACVRGLESAYYVSMPSLESPDRHCLGSTPASLLRQLDRRTTTRVGLLDSDR